MKLLIVEDDRLLSNALARSLRDAYAVDQAFDGEEGLFYAAQDVYDLVVLDVMLPERDGFSVLEALRAQGVDTPVLMLTASRPSCAARRAGATWASLRSRSLRCTREPGRPSSQTSPSL